MLSNDITIAIRNQRSIRKYTEDAISNDCIETILEAGRWAPSGLNNQPVLLQLFETTKKKAEFHF
jgi:nitroreductase